MPDLVPLDGVVQREGWHLCYVGISPRTRTNRIKPSSQNLYTRVRYHYRGNAEGSTLRLTLGCLLSDELGIELRRMGSGKRFTFTPAGEARLGAWMASNARVGWSEHHHPEEVEQAAIVSLSLPLNIEHNGHHGFVKQLSAIRAGARARARELPVWES